MHVYSPVPAPRADLPLPPAQLPCAAAADGGIVLPISDAEWSNALLLAKRSAEIGLRSEIVGPDAGSLGARIRQSRLVPYQAITGAKEAAEDQVAVRLRDGRRLDPRLPTTCSPASVHWSTPVAWNCGTTKISELYFDEFCARERSVGGGG